MSADDPSRDDPRPSRREGGRVLRRGTRQDSVRYGIVLVLLLATFVFLASGPKGRWVPLVSTVLQGATLLAALRASHTEARWYRIALVVVALACASAVLSLFVTSSAVNASFYGLNAFFVAAAPVAIARGAVRRGALDIQTVLGALCIYVLLGMLWAFLYGAINEVTSTPFFAQTASASLADFLYFSFITLTTVGYGDLTAAGGLGRAVAVLEALTGQLYLVTVVALVVSNLGQLRAQGRSAR
jgi:hypothetical protein